MFEQINEKIKRVAIYCRVSTDEQVVNWTSLNFQKEQLLRYVEFNKNKYRINKENHIYIDWWFSWWSNDRPGLNRMMLDARRWEFDIILVYKLDRFFRKTLFLLQYIEELQINDVDFKSTTQDFDTSTPYWKMMIWFLWIIAELERDTIRERSVTWKLAKSRDKYAVWWWTVKYWYKKIQLPWGKKLKIVEEEAKVIRRIFKMYTEWEKSINKISDILSNEKVLTRYDKDFKNKKKNKKKVEWFWHESTVRWILKEEMYIWNNYYWKTYRELDKKTWKTITKYREKTDPLLINIGSPIILKDKKVFYKAQELLSINKRKLNNKIPHLLTEYINCWKCWRGFRWYKTRKWTISYRCWWKTAWKVPKELRCDNSEISELILIDILWKKIRPLLSNSDKFLEEYYDKTNKSLNPSIKYENELIDVWDEIHNLTKWLSNAYEKLYIETIDFKKVIKEKLVQDLENRLEIFNDRRDKLMVKLEKLNKTEKNKSNIKRVISKFKYNLNNKITYKEKVEIIKEFLDKIIIVGNWRIDISLKFFTWNDNENWYNDDEWW